MELLIRFHHIDKGFILSSSTLMKNDKLDQSKDLLLKGPLQRVKIQTGRKHLHIIYLAEYLYIDDVKYCQISVRIQATILTVSKRFEQLPKKMQRCKISIEMMLKIISNRLQ